MWFPSMTPASVFYQYFFLRLVCLKIHTDYVFFHVGIEILAEHNTPDTRKFF